MISANAQQTLLSQVARSFYFTLKFLPKAVRAQLSTAYLLARISDTIADTNAIPAAQSLEQLYDYKTLIKTGSQPKLIQQLWQTRTKYPAPLSELLKHTLEIVEVQQSFSSADQAELSELLDTIINTQISEVEKIKQEKWLSFDTCADLESYTYGVAGCVGKFWTQLCYRHISNYSRMPITPLLESAINFGKGLQLINILRDLPADLTNQRCFLPKQQLEQYQLTKENFLQYPEKLVPIHHYWLAKAYAYLQAGWDYWRTIRPLRMRYTLSLPLLIGSETLALLKNTNYLNNATPIKISRNKLKKIMLIASLGIVSERFLTYYQGTSDGNKTSAQ